MPADIVDELVDQHPVVDQERVFSIDPDGMRRPGSHKS